MKYSPSFIRGTAVGTVVSLGILAAVPVMAFRGDENARGPRFNPEHREQMQEIMETGDYEAFKSMVEESGRKGKILETITEENFSTFVDMHNLMRSGDREGAKALREELDLPLPIRHGRRGGMRCKPFGRGKMMDLTEEEREVFKEAMHECKENGETREEVRECRRGVFESLKGQE